MNLEGHNEPINRTTEIAVLGLFLLVPAVIGGVLSEVFTANWLIDAAGAVLGIVVGAFLYLLFAEG